MRVLDDIQAALEAVSHLLPLQHEWNDDDDHESGVDVRDRSGLRAALCEFDDDCLATGAAIVAAVNHASALVAVARAAAAYESEQTNPVKDYTMVQIRRRELFAALAALEKAGGGE